MKDSRLLRSILAPVWIAACLATIMGGSAAGIHLALGLGRLIRNPLHHWQARSDWIECFLWAFAATVFAAMPTIWRFRRNRLRKLKQPAPAAPQAEVPEPAIPQPNPAGAAWKG